MKRVSKKTTTGSGGGWHSLPNHAVEPTPTAYAPTSLRLLARLTADVRLQFCRGSKVEALAMKVVVVRL